MRHALSHITGANQTTNVCVLQLPAHLSYRLFHNAQSHIHITPHVPPAQLTTIGARLLNLACQHPTQTASTKYHLQLDVPLLVCIPVPHAHLHIIGAQQIIHA